MLGSNNIGIGVNAASWDRYRRQELAVPFNQQEAVPADAGSQKLLMLLSSLRETKAGTQLYQQIEQLLQASAQESLQQQRAYAKLLDLLLEGLAHTLPVNSELRLNVKLLQVRIQPPLAACEFQSIQNALQQMQPQLLPDAQQSEAALRQSLSPLLAAFGLSPAAPRAQAARDEQAAPVERQPPASPSPQKYILKEHRPTPSFEKEPAQRANSVFRQHLSEQQKSIQQLESDLLEKIRSIQKCHHEFSALLGKTLKNTQQAQTPQDIQDLRETMIQEAKGMVQGNEMLSETLDGAYHYLKALQKDGQRMSDELARVHLLSLTDELTGLPNRRAFLRHLDDEVSRSKRYQFPLTVAIVDLDHFKSVNDRFGHAVGDAVLRNYAKDIFAVLRHHDIVARFGGEEFAVMLPNTSLENGLAALNKVLNRARQSRFVYQDQEYHVPTLSAGLAQFQNGENITALIERADTALYRAKERGRNQLATDPETVPQSTPTSQPPVEPTEYHQSDLVDDLITWTAPDQHSASER